MSRYTTDHRIQFNRDPKAIHTWDPRKIKRRRAARRKLYILFGVIIGLSILVLILIARL